MTLHQFEIFYALAKAKSFTKVAHLLHITQSTVSEHIADLEQDLGAKLFDRGRGSVTMTEAGRLLHDYATRITSAVADARRTIAELNGLQRGSLVLGASTTPGTYVLPPVIAAFRRRYPGINVSLGIANSRVIEERVRADEVDLGVVDGHILRTGERCVAAGLLDELLLIVPPRHPWAKRRQISARDLSGTALLMREDGSATRQVTERVLRQAGVRFSTAMELDHVEAVKQAVMAGLGVAFVSAYAIAGELATRRLAAVRLQGVRVRRHFHVIHNEARTLTTSGRAFMELLEQSGPRQRVATRS
jgi:DNA-binding transcriptional LysR family regulator